MIDLDAIAARDRAWSGESQTATSPEADRRALLEHITELEVLAEETSLDLAAIKALVRTMPRQAHKTAPLTRAEQQSRWRSEKGLTGPQWRMLEELSERNKNPDNEWSFPHKMLKTGARLVTLGLAKEHERNAYRCSFSITDDGRDRLTSRRQPRGKLARHEEHGDSVPDPT